MRWWVETTDLTGSGDEPVELAADAATSLDALAAVAGPASGASSSLELLGDGLRAVDRRGQRRYVVLPASSPDPLASWLESDGSDEPPPSYEVVISRDHDPTSSLPLTYRERGLRVASTASPEGVANLLWGLLDELRRGVADRPPGKVFELAAFSGALGGAGARAGEPAVAEERGGVDERADDDAQGSASEPDPDPADPAAQSEPDRSELPPPRVTLSYRDWRQEAALTFAGAPPQRFLVADEAFSDE